MIKTFKGLRGTATLYFGDCLEILPTLERVDAVIADPPYGINYEASRYPGALFDGIIAGDELCVDVTPLLVFPRVAIWGANNFANTLPAGGWLCWDKRCMESADKMMGSPFELAWVNDRQKFKMKRLQHGGCVNADGDESRLHPTQKPVAIMAWSMDVVKTPTGATVLDPFMGSGTTGIACLRTGRNFIGIEIDPKHYATACERIAREIDGELL